MGNVCDLAVGTRVLVLPRSSQDVRWGPVVLNEDMESWKVARFTWSHPDCLRPSNTDRNAVITNGHTKERDFTPASHNIGPKTPSGRRDTNGLVLDARWLGRYRYSGECKGYCCDVVRETMRNSERMADILDFAFAQGSGMVACKLATHRSVAAGKIFNCSAK